MSDLLQIGKIYVMDGYALLMTEHGLVPAPEPMSNRYAVTCAKRFKRLSDLMEPIREGELAALPYAEFLKSKYWKTVRDYVEALYRVCQRCGSTLCLQVHHKTYEHRGCEWRFLNDLELLCDKCHYKETYPEVHWNCCKCGGTGILAKGYCNCKMGHDLMLSMERPQATRLNEARIRNILKNLV